MSVRTIWVLCEPTASGISTPSLELLTAARSLAEHRRGDHLGERDRVERRGPRRVRRERRCTTSASCGGALPGVPVAAAIAGLVATAGAPDAILIPTSYDGRDVAGRLSVRLDRPCSRTSPGSREDGGLVAEHPVFGGTLTVYVEVHRRRAPASSWSARSPSPPSHRAVPPPP